MTTTPRWPYPRLIGHRGGGDQAPENTLAGLRAARAAGLDGVEFDAMLAGDGVAILMHDHRLGRTVAGRGSVAGLRSTDLQGRDAGSYLHPRFQGEGVPTLDQALSELEVLALWANIEIKPAPGHDSATGAVVAQTVWHWWQRRTGANVVAPDGVAAPLLSSFSMPALHAARQAAPGLARALLVDAIPRDVEVRLQAVDARALHVRHDHLSPEAVQRLHAGGWGVMAYTVNDPDRASTLLAWGVDAVCTDRLDLAGARPG